MNPKDIINMDYEVGDKVQIRKDLITCQKYGLLSLISGMEQYLGDIVTIRFVGKYRNGKSIDPIYDFFEVPYSWSEPMIRDIQGG